jgi:hypothetical protein
LDDGEGLRNITKATMGNIHFGNHRKIATLELYCMSESRALCSLTYFNGEFTILSMIRKGTISKSNLNCQIVFTLLLGQFTLCVTALCLTMHCTIRKSPNKGEGYSTEQVNKYKFVKCI